MTLQQEAYRRIDKLSDEGVRLLISIIDNIQDLSISGFRQADKSIGEKQETSSDIVDTINTDTLDSMTKKENKQLFFQSAGKMKIDSGAIRDLRERSKS